MPNVGLAGNPVGIPLLSELLARITLGLGFGASVPVCALRGLTNGFRPPIGIKIPALVKRPHLTSSRRETWPWERAFVISWRSRRAFSASRIRLLSEYSFNQILSSRPLRPMLILLLTSFGSQLKQRNSFGQVKN